MSFLSFFIYLFFKFLSLFFLKNMFMFFVFFPRVLPHNQSPTNNQTSNERTHSLLIDENALKHRNKDTPFFFFFFFYIQNLSNLSLWSLFWIQLNNQIQPIGSDQPTFSRSSIHLEPNHESLLFQNVPQVKLRFH